MNSGMNIDSVLAYAGFLRNQVVPQLDAARAAIGDLNALEWTGPDADAFRNEHVTNLQTTVGQLLQSAEQLARSAEQSAAEQTRTSSSL